MISDGGQGVQSSSTMIAVRGPDVWCG